MFASQFSAPSPTAFASQWLGRFMSPSASGASGDGVAAASAAQGTEAEHDEDRFPDLAQRVREIGEW